MEEWKEYKLGELITLNSGGTPDKNNNSYWDGDIPWISAKFMYDDYLYSSELKISQDGLTSGSRLAPKGSILLLTRGSGLFNRIPVCYTMRDLAYNQDVKCIESKNKELVSTEFLFYWLMGNKDSISAILETTGIGAGKIDTNRLKNIRISLPPKEYQQILIGFAESIMHKIEVNKRINDNLEQQAQALFKSWFVDFEPFKDGDFVESELGMIPKGWRVEPLTCLIKFQEGPGIRNWQYVQENGTKFINIRCIKVGDIYTETANMISNEEANGKYAHFMLEVGDIVMSCSGTLGRYAIVREDHLPLCLNTSVIRFKPVLPNNYSYVLGFLTSSYFLNKQIEMACGSVQANFGPTHLKQMKILVPPQTIITQYEEKCISLITLMQKKKYENKHLATLRDTLLPKLLSGELKVNEVEI